MSSLRDDQWRRQVPAVSLVPDDEVAGTDRHGAVSPHCLDDNREDSRGSRVQPPKVNLHLEVRFHRVPMKLALVAGVRPNEECMRWTVVAPNGTHTRALKRARLYAFTKAGRDAAATDGKGLKAMLACGDSWIDFVWRVLVEGPWERPKAVTPVWIIEGHARPVPVPYYFD